jgi:thioredoxin-like negative regulator of GroEL
MSQGARRGRAPLLLALATAGLLWGAWTGSEIWRFRQTLARIKEQMGNGRVSRAAKDLAELLARNPGSDEVAFLLGTCEQARGRAGAAAKAWAAVPSGSPFAYRALEGRVALEIDQGRLTDAEQLVIKALEGPRTAGRDPRVLLGAVYCREGRLKEALRVLEALWRHQNESGEADPEWARILLWLYIQYRSNPIPEAAIRAILEQAGQVAPNDDRIWLWKANLAIRTKSYEVAARWLDRCLERRPEDIAVWQARLDWAVATQHVGVAREALKHLPAAESNPAQVEKLAAWFAAQRSDDEAERNSLERLIVADPTDIAALDRLVDLHLKNGQSDLAAALHHRKDEIARLQARYAKLVKRHQPRRDAAEMARVAEQLGYRFEAKAFLTIALAARPDRDDFRRDLARLARSNEMPAGPARTLDDLLAPQLDDAPQKTRSIESSANSKGDALEWLGILSRIEAIGRQRTGGEPFEGMAHPLERRPHGRIARKVTQLAGVLAQVK